MGVRKPASYSVLFLLNLTKPFCEVCPSVNWGLGHRMRQSIPSHHSLASSHLKTGQNCETASFEPRQFLITVVDSCVSVCQLCVHMCVWGGVHTCVCACVYADMCVFTYGSQREAFQVCSHHPTYKGRISPVCSSDQLLQGSRLPALQPVLLPTALCLGWEHRHLLLHPAFYVGSGDGTQAIGLVWLVLLLTEPSPQP